MEAAVSFSTTRRKKTTHKPFRVRNHPLLMLIRTVDTMLVSRSALGRGIGSIFGSARGGRGFAVEKVRGLGSSAFLCICGKQKCLYSLGTCVDALHLHIVDDIDNVIRYDDLGKEVGLKVPQLEDYRDLIRDHLVDESSAVAVRADL